MLAKPRDPDDIGGLRRWGVQWQALMHKHLLVLKRTPVMLALAVLGPALMVVVASIVAASLKASLSRPHIDTTTDPTIPIELKVNVCTTSPTCRPAYYYAPKDPYHATVMDVFAQRTGLTVASSLDGGDIVGFSSIEVMLDAFYRDARVLNHRSSAQTIAFTTFDGDAPVSSFADATERLSKAKLTTYSIGENYHPLGDLFLPEAFGMHQGAAAATKVALDASIIAVRRAQTLNKPVSADGRLVIAQEDVPDMKLSLAVFPHVPHSSSGNLEIAVDSTAKPHHNDFGTAGELATTSLMVLGFCPLVLLINQLIGQDKHNAHLGVLRKLALFESAYWASVTTVLVGTSIVISALSVLTAKIVAPSYYLFANIDIGVLFVLQLLFALSLAAMGLLCVAALSHPYSTTTLTIFVLMIGPLFCFALDSSGVLETSPWGSQTRSNADLLHAGAWFDLYVNRAVVSGLVWLPFFHYGRLVAEMKAGTALSNFTSHYSFANLTLGHGPYNSTVVRMDNDIHLEVEDRTLYTVPPAIGNLLWMLALFVGYMAVGYLLNQLVPGRSGSAGIRLNLLRLAGLRRGHKSAIDVESAQQSREIGSVVIQGMTKKFGKLAAVNDISLTLRKGRCLALLGHNGAGKSTLINMLSGLLGPTTGNAYVFGHALTHGAAPIQRMLGTCPQDDIQYPQLTAREHLQLYARFKGVPTSQLNEYIDERLDMVGLLEHADQPVGEFSGGMKRRLSIVSAGIGDPQFVILDEPTTGMDPINRRKVWQYIARLKRDCVLLLTSHSMEETDALGDDICIIDHGQVQATGTSLELKNAHGTGYQINLLTWQNRIDELLTFVTEALPQAHISASTATSLSVVVGCEDMAHLPAFLNKLQTVMRLPESERVVKDWGIQNASLEQVFLKLTRTEEEEGAADTNTKDKPPAPQNDADHDQEVPRLEVEYHLLTQVWAVAAKNFTFQRKQLKTNDGSLSFAALPPVMYAMTEMLGRFDVKHGQYHLDSRSTCDYAALKGTLKEYLTVCSPSTRHFCDTPDYGGFQSIPSVDDPAPQVWVDGGDDKALAIMRNQTRLRYLQQSPTLSQLGEVLKQDSSPKALSRSFHLLPIDGAPDARVLAAQQRILDDASNGSTTCPGGFSDYARVQYPYVGDVVTAATLMRQQFPDRAISFASDAPHATLRYYGWDLWKYDISYQVDGSWRGSNDCYVFNRYDGWDDDMQLQLQDVLSRDDTLDSSVRHFLGAIANTYAQQLVGDGESIQSNVIALTAVVYSESGQLVATLMFVLILLWLFPVYLLVPFAEREERLFAYFRVNGLSTAAYWLGNYLYCLLSSLVFIAMLIGSSKAYFPQSNVGMTTPVLLLGVHSTIGMAFLYASLAGPSIIARLFAYLVPIVLTLLSVLFVFRDFLGASMSNATSACLFPPIALAYSLRIVLQSSETASLIVPLLMMLVVGTVCIAASIWLALLQERTAQVSGILQALFRRSRSSAEADQEESIGTLDTIDPDVLAEVTRVDNTEKHNADLAVKIQHLSKRFGTFTAVDNLTLGIDKGECFGLLGPNGSGYVRPWKLGSATVGGYDIKDSRLSGVLGLCPQDNRVMKDLTVEENLLFFARVRGASRKVAKSYARQAANMVGLTGGAYHRAAEHLSGGMRRRLSIAIALIGLPPVIILDEPTTGLDPGNRMQIWDIIAKIRDRREHCIILISHLMEEVDALTSRIGIMAAGSLRCLGNQVSLKNRFASGYTLYVQMTVTDPSATGSAHDHRQVEAARLDQVTQFVHAHVSDSAVLSAGGAHGLGEPAIDPASQSWTASFQYRLPSGVDLARVFTEMEQGAAQLGVVEWSLNQSSLEDVFVEVAAPFVR
ncbi:hypothetical protein RI367_007933 [Sorochytrium milnesiophthora]